MSSPDENQASSVADDVDPNSQTHPPIDQMNTLPSPTPSSSPGVDELTLYELPVDSFIITSPIVFDQASATVEQPQIVQLASVPGANLQLNFPIGSSPLQVSPTPETDFVMPDMLSLTPGQYYIYSVPQPTQLAITYPTSDNPVPIEPPEQDPLPGPSNAGQDLDRRRPKTACECPNCRRPEAERPRYPGGELEHICHVNYCRRTFDRVSNLRRHLDWHRGTRSFFCQTCDKGYARRDKFDEHVRRHITSKRRRPVARTKCDCPNCSGANEYLVIGLNGKPLHLCHMDGCKKAFCYVGNLRKHLLAHQAKLYFVCKFCKKRFHRQDELNQHIKTHKIDRGNDRRRVNCNCPNCTAPGGNKTKGFDGKPQHICYIGDCRQTFNLVGNLKRHLYLHTGEKKFVCPHCDWKFARKDKYDEHVRKVHAIWKRRKCKCPNCLSGKKVRGKNGRLLHVCHLSDCRNTYDKVVKLRRHLKIHNVDLMYFCKLAKCPEMFLSKSGRDAHIKSAHPRQRQQIECPCANCNVEDGNQVRDKDEKLIHNCPIPGCDKDFSRPSHVQRHLDSHDGKKKFVCPSCSRWFARKESLKNHIMEHVVQRARVHE